MSRIHKMFQKLTWVAGLAVAFPGCVTEASEPKSQSRPAASAVMKEFQQAGRNASVTVLPTLLAGNPMPQVGNAIGMLLERGGMGDVQTSDAEFRPPQDAGLDQTAEALGTFARGHQYHTAYIMFNDIRVLPQRKVSEVRSIVVDRAGQVVWTDTQNPADPDFKRIKPSDPLTCCMLVVERLRPVLKLDDPSRSRAAPGKLAQQWEKQTGLPDKVEQKEIERRQEAFKKTAAKSSMLIYPVRVADEMDSASAAHLKSIINQAAIAKASAVTQGTKLQVQPNMNEQKVLWSMARAFRDEVRKSRPDADYVLFADYMMNGNRAGAVHFVVCDREGEWVIVDYQNSHHPDFKSINPKSREDCDRLVLKRLQHYCK